MNRGEDVVTDFVEQWRNVKQSCTLSPNLFNIHTDDAVDYVSETDLHAPVTGTKTDLGLLFLGDLVVSSLTIRGLEKAIDQIAKCCKDWNLKCKVKCKMYM